MPKVRVLTLTDIVSTSGGAERLAAELTKRLDPGRFERTLCVTRWDPAGRAGLEPHSAEADEGTFESLADAGVEVLRIERRARIAPRAWRRLYRYLREERIDIVHAHKFGANVWGAAIGRLARVPVLVAHEHSWAFEGSPARQLIDRHLIGRFSDALIAVSSEDRRRMIEVERIPATKVRFIPSGMPSVPQLGEAGDLRAELGLGERPVIGAVGSLRPEKAFDVLVRAAAVLAPRFPDLQVVVAGDGDRRPLQNLARELGVQDSVHLLGFRSDVASVTAAFDVAINTSDREGSPLSIMEYMEAGLPVVATRVGGTPDLVSDGVTGLLVPPRDPESLAAAVTRLLDDRALAKAMGERGRERRRERFDLGAMTERVEALYEELLASKGKGGRTD